MINNLYRQSILPRLCFFPYFIAKSILSIIALFNYDRLMPSRVNFKSSICIEAGEKGWESIEFKEIYQSACEYMNPENVHCLVVRKDKNYLNQISSIVKKKSITHYLYDPRTVNSDGALWSAMWQSFRVSLLLAKNGIVPIVLLTDLSVRAWRTQAAIVTARYGLVISFMAPKSIGSIFPHKRLLGPSLMPFSIKTKKILDELIQYREENNPRKALFVGTLYNPRKAVLEQIHAGLTERGFNFEIKGRAVGGKRTSDLEYWSRLTFSDIVITTADQMLQEGTDWVHIPHLIYRYLEALASGALLVAQEVPSIQRYFTPGIHFISFSNSNDAIEKVAYYLENDEARLRVAKNGKKRADELISSRSFWMTVDACLGENSIH